MKSLDTNILFYGTNVDSPEHAWARPVVDEMLATPSDWLLADQVLLEYYRLIRNPTVLDKPLSAAAAAARVRFFREEVGCRHVAYAPSSWPTIMHWIAQSSFRPAQTFDLLLAVTLRFHGVQTFYTRNNRDFDAFKFFEVINPDL